MSLVTESFLFSVIPRVGSIRLDDGLQSYTGRAYVITREHLGQICRC